MEEYKTAFQCDYCPTLFPTMSQASRHEASCPDRPPPPAAAAGNNNRAVASSKNGSTKTQNLIHCTLFKCNQCKLLFRHEAAASRHEESCADSDWVSCTKCLVQRFRTAELRSAHEAECGGKGSYNFEDLPLANEEEEDRGADEVVVIDLQSSDEGEEPPMARGVHVKCEQGGGAAAAYNDEGAESSAADGAESLASSDNAPLGSLENQQNDNRDNAQDDTEQWTTVWTVSFALYQCVSFLRVFSLINRSTHSFTFQMECILV